MGMDPSAWIVVYRKLLPTAVCLDIETTGWNGPIAVVGIYVSRRAVPGGFYLDKTWAEQLPG